MTYQHERDDFIATMARHNIPTTDARTLLRYAATLQRLAEAQCNGDWPADNGERAVVPCPKCEAGFVPSTIKASTYLPRGLKACPDCRTSAAVVTLLSVYPEWRPVFGGDPRGAVLKLAPSAAADEDVQSGRVRCIAVPARS